MSGICNVSLSKIIQAEQILGNQLFVSSHFGPEILPNLAYFKPFRLNEMVYETQGSQTLSSNQSRESNIVDI